MLIYWFSSSFRMGDALPGPWRSHMQLHPAGRAVVPFSWCWLVYLCHVIKTTKMADKLEKTLTFQTETNILHHYKGILLLKLLWQNRNYQLVLCGSRDWSLRIWLCRLRQWPRSLGINLTNSHTNVVVNSSWARYDLSWVTMVWVWYSMTVHGLYIANNE